MVDWITVKDLAEIQRIIRIFNISEEVRKAIAKNKYVTRIADGTTGKMYEILVSSLDDGTQKIINFEKSKRELENIEEPKTRKKERIPLNAHAIALARFDLVNLWVDFKNNANYSKTIAGDDFINIYNEGKVYPKIFKTIGRK